MAKDKDVNLNEKPEKLKILHLFWTIIVAATLVGVGWGVMRNEQVNQGNRIEKKVEKEVFQMHLEAQRQQTKTFVETVNKGFDRMDKRLENIEKKD